MPVNLFSALAVVLGLALSVLVALMAHQHRQPFLYLLCFAYSAGFHGLLVLWYDRTFDWKGVLLMGAIFIGLGWITVWLDMLHPRR